MSDLKVSMTSDATQVLQSLTRLNQSVEKLAQTTAKTSKETEKAAKWFNSLTGQVTIGGLRQLGANLTNYVLSPLRLIGSAINASIESFKKFQTASIDAFKSSSAPRFQLMRQGLSGSQVNAVMALGDRPGHTLSSVMQLQAITGGSFGLLERLAAISADTAAARGMDVDSVAQVIGQLYKGQLGGTEALGVSEEAVAAQVEALLGGRTDENLKRAIERQVSYQILGYLGRRDRGAASAMRALEPTAQIVDPFAPTMRRFGEFFINAQSRFFGQFAPSANRIANVTNNTPVSTLIAGLGEMSASGQLAKIISDTLRSNTLIQSVKDMFIAAGNVLLELLRAGTQVVLDTIASRLGPTAQAWTGLYPSNMTTSQRFARTRRQIGKLGSAVMGTLSSANDFAVSLAEAGATVIEAAPAAASAAKGRAEQQRSDAFWENTVLNNIVRRTDRSPVSL